MSRPRTKINGSHRRSTWDLVLLAIASGGGIGFVMPAPGTWGTLLGIGLCWLLASVHPAGLAWSIVLALCLVGIPICTRAARLLDGKDPSPVVWDEIASTPWVFVFVPMESLAVAMMGFLLHRLFDVTKPPPTRYLEGWPAGLGIMADDWMAAAYAAVGLWCCKQLLLLGDWQLLS